MNLSLRDCPGLSPAEPARMSRQDQTQLELCLPYHPDRALAAASKLRSLGRSSQDVSYLLTQARLRTKAQQKFGQQAQKLLLTEAGYEQASRPTLASYRAQRLAQSGLSNILDLGCGIGTDSLAFAAANLGVRAVELDKETASFAAHNLADYPTARVFCGDLTQLSPDFLARYCQQHGAGIWLDPARRKTGQGPRAERIFDPQEFAPPFSYILDLTQTGVPLAVKLGPATAHELIPQAAEAQWISQSGTVLELILWFNGLARKGISRAASTIDQQGQLCTEITSSSSQSRPAKIADLETYLYEPDGAVIRSHLVADLARELGAHLIDRNIAYLSSQHYRPHPAAQAYRVLATMPVNLKLLKRWVREENISSLTIKKRGLDIRPEDLRKKLLAGTGKGSKGQEATLILTRIGQGKQSQRIAIQAQPIPHSSKMT